MVEDALERLVKDYHLEKHVLLPGFRTDVLGCIKSFDLFVMSSVTEGLGTSLLDAMACARPIVLTLSNPTSKVEARPEQLLAWTNGAAIVGTGSPFAPVSWNGVSHQIGQCNNAFVFPGIGLGATVVGARAVPDEAFAAAAMAVSCSPKSACTMAKGLCLALAISACLRVES